MKFSRSRFRAVRTADATGAMHASIGEARWFDGLLLRQRAGEISELTREPSFAIKVAAHCPICASTGKWVGAVKLDASWIENESGAFILADYKGVEGNTPLSKFKRRLVEAMHGISVRLEGPAAAKAAKDKRKRELMRTLRE